MLKIIKDQVYDAFEDNWVTVEYERMVCCPKCYSEDVDLADEPQPVDSSNVYDTKTYSVVCNGCQHLFYEETDIWTELYP